MSQRRGKQPCFDIIIKNLEYDNREALIYERITVLVSKEAVVLRRWGVETNVWCMNRVDN